MITRINFTKENSLFHEEILRLKSELDYNQDKIESVEHIIEYATLKKHQKDKLIIEYNTLVKKNRIKIRELTAIAQCKNSDLIH